MYIIYKMKRTGFIYENTENILDCKTIITTTTAQRHPCLGLCLSYIEIYFKYINIYLWSMFYVSKLTLTTALIGSVQSNVQMIN